MKEKTYICIKTYICKLNCEHIYEGKNIYLYKIVNINFFIIFKTLSKFQELSSGKVK